MVKPLVYILVLNYNGAKDTIECINSLQKISYNNYKIVIIDNKSTDNSLCELEQFNSSCIFIKSEENLGYAGGNNLGIKYAMESKADYILILNNDTIVEKDFLSNIINSCEKDNVSVASPKVYFYDNKRINAFGASKDFLERVKNIGENKVDGVDYENDIYVKYIMGCCMLIKTDVIEDVGMFDDKFFMYLEETDLCERINKKYKIKVCASSKIYHKCGASTKSSSKINYFTEYYFRRNLLYFLMKNCSLTKRIFIQFLIMIKDLVDVVNNSKDKKYRKILFLAWKDYFNRNMYKSDKLMKVINEA